MITRKLARADGPRTILLTGATGGIGGAIAGRLLERGHRVLGVGRNFQRGAIVHERFVPVPVDLGALDALPEALTALAQAHPEVSALVLAAGRGHFGSLEEFSYDQMRELLELNFVSQAFVVRAFLPALKSLHRADLVFLGSEAALAGGRRGAIYSASKFALRGFAQSLREECSRSGVHVCLVNPGMVRTPFFDALSFGPGDEEENAVDETSIAQAVELALESPFGTVLDEINLSPLKKVVKRRRP